MATHSNNQYYVPHGSVYPSIISVGLLSLASGFIFSVATDRSKELAYLQAPGKWMMILGALLILAMVFKLATSAEQGWRRLNGAERLADIITGVPFKDGVKVEGQRIAA